MIQPGEAFYYINNQLCDGNERGMFVTVWMSVIDLKTGRGVAVNAGHASPCICRKGGEFELVEYQHEKAVREKVAGFAGNAQQYDDITMMCLYFKGQA